MNIRRVKYKDIEQAAQFSIPKNFKTNFQGSSPAPFIGRFGYPNVNIGLLSPQFPGDTSYYDSPQLWSKANFSINRIASLRYGLVNSQTAANVKQLNGRFLELVQEVGMASKAVELEISLTKTPELSLKPEKEIIPFGPRSEIKKAAITANPKVEQKVERVVRDTDLKAASAILNLYNNGFEQNFLTKLISVGSIGLKQNRRLVPTRWSITAVDDTLGKTLIQEVKDFPLGEYAAYFGGGWGNYYLLLFFPKAWSYELFETYLERKQGCAYSTDYENYDGRKEYAEETAGGYYACRLSILEKMKELKRQHSCLALRFITAEYNIPLGVWVCREAAKKSAQAPPVYFASEELLLQYTRESIQRKFGFKLELLLEQSRLLKENSRQKRLSEF